MGEVTALPGHVIKLPEGSANQEIVAALEGLLDMAKAGQIHAIAWATYNKADTITRGWVNGAYGFHIAAALMLLQHDYGGALSAADVD